MSILIPCQAVGTPSKHSNQGTMIVEGLPAPPAMGGGVFDTVGGVWTLSNKSAAGWPIDWERDLGPGDIVHVLTATGSNESTIVSIDATNPDFTALTVTQNTFAGFLVEGQATGVWKSTPSGLPCNPTGPGPAGVTETPTEPCPPVRAKHGYVHDEPQQVHSPYEQVGV